MSDLKRFFATVLSFILILSPLTLSANAKTEANGERSHDVLASYEDSQPSEIVTVDLSWGSFEFVYHAKKLGTWNPESHQYIGGEPAKWTCVDGANVLVITNHSNVAVQANVSYCANSDFNSITGSFDNDTIGISAATQGTSYDSAPSATVKLTLSGDLDITDKSYHDEDKKQYMIGSVMVDIN